MFCVSLPLCAQQGVHFPDIPFEQSLTYAVKQHKNVLLTIYENGCGHCEKMLNEVLTDADIGAFCNANFICMKKEMSEPGVSVLMKKYAVSSFPTFIILNADAEVLYQFYGELKKQEFLETAQQALAEENQIPYLRKNFENNLYDSTACYTYLKVLSKGRIPTQAVVEKYFEANKNNFEISAGNWKILSAGVSDISSAPFQFIIENRDAFAAVVTQKKVDRKIYLTCAYNLLTAANANDTTQYFLHRTAAEKTQNTKVDSLIFATDLAVYEKNKHYDAYLQRAFTATQEFYWNDATQLRRIGEIFLNKSTDTVYLAKAQTFAQRSAELKPDYFNTILAAKLAMKLGDKPAAKIFAEQAKEIAVKNRTNKTEAENILQQCN